MDPVNSKLNAGLVYNKAQRITKLHIWEFNELSKLNVSRVAHLAHSPHIDTDVNSEMT